MTLPFTLPDWVPWWVSLVVLVPVILLGLAFLFMPFSVFGLKGRLEGVEARLDEIQGEIRSLALRLPERLERYERDPRADGPPARRWALDEPQPSWQPGDELLPRQAAAPPQSRWQPEAEHPPIPPAPAGRYIEDRPPPPPNRPVDPTRGGRAEPRFGPR